jgi:hypothetical protein
MTMALSAAAAPPLSSPPAETVVVAPAPAASSPSGAVSVDTSSVVDAEGALLGVPGVALARDGGPLSSSRPLLRGLGGPRLLVDVAGLGFNDPVAGGVDASLLPLSLGRAVIDVGAVGGSLAGTLSMRGAPGSQLHLVVGELSTLQLGGRVRVPVAAGSTVAAVDVGTSRGDFPFVTGGAVDRVALVRANNDQRRARVAVVTDTAGDAPAAIGGQLQARLVTAGAWSDGGVAGFATAPLTLRAHNTLGMVGAVVEHAQPGHTTHVSGSVTGSDRATSDATAGVNRNRNADRITGRSGTIGLGVTDHVVTRDDVMLMTSVDVGVGGADVDDAAHRQQAQASGMAGLRLPLAARWLLKLDGRAAVQVVDDDDDDDDHDVGDDAANRSGAANQRGPTWLPTGGLRATLIRTAVADGHDGGGGEVGAFVGVSRAARAPTLDERFAPAGFLVAAPDLRPEAVTDVELGATIAVPSLPMLLAATAFGSWLDDAIVIVNDNAFVVRPRNTGPALRAGSELLLRTRPHRLLGVDTAASLLWSQVQATNAPLPTAPPLALRTAVTVGDDTAFTRATITARGAAPSTIFGTLPSAPYALVDVMARVPLSSSLGLTMHVHNALDVQTATDVNLLPLPGRLLFIGLEVRS